MPNGKTILGGLAGKAEGELRGRRKRIEEQIDEATQVEAEPMAPVVPNGNRISNGNGNGNGTRRRRDNYPWD